MFPSLRLPVVDAMWRLSLGPREAEALLVQEEARYTARLDAVRHRAPPTHPIGLDSKVQSEDPPPKEDEDEEDLDEEEEFTDDDGPAGRF